MKEKKLKKFGLLNLIALILLVVVLSVVPTLVVIKEKNKAIEENFFGEISDFAGILTIWNIDTFEGGSASKQSYLESVARLFEKKLKKTYVHIVTYSIEGLIIALEEGKRPDLFSFSNGTGEIVAGKLIDLNPDSEIIKVFLDSGKVNGAQKAIPYATGGYGLFSTSQNLNAAGKEYNENLLDIVYSSSYEKQLRKKTKLIPSVSFGSEGYVLPQAALFHAKRIPVNIEPLSTSYDAYVGFVGYESSTILLGNQRDLARLSNKLKLSQISDLIFSPVPGYTDLVQYLGVCKDSDELRQKIAVEFIKFTLKKEQQHKLSEIGLFSVTNLNLYQDVNFYSELERVLKSEIVVPSVFRTTVERNSEINSFKG